MHGGDIYHHDIDLDFSVNLNPCIRDEADEAAIESAMQAGLKEAVHYPDLTQRSLREALADAEGIDAANVLAGNGASELLLAIVAAIAPKTALLIEPCYTGYAHVLNTQKDCETRHFLLREERGFALTEEILHALTAQTDLVFLQDPVNPTGQNMDPALLDQILHQAKICHTTVVLDRSFYALSDAWAMQDQPNGTEEKRKAASNRYL